MNNFFSKILCCKNQDIVLENISDSETMVFPENEKSNHILDSNKLIFYGLLEGIKILSFDLPSNRFVKKIVIGKNHILILLDSHEMGILGSNSNGQLGLPLMEKFVEKIEFNKLKFSEEEEEVNKKQEIIDIACGDDYSMVLIINDLNEKFLYHLEVKKEEKYLDDDEDTSFHLLVKKDLKLQNTTKQKSIKTVHYVETLFNNNIVSIYAFGKRRALITSDNSIYFFGIDFSLNILKYYTKVLCFESTIKMFSFGNDHALLLDQNGLIFSWGNSTFGELGIENAVFLDKPIPIPFFNNIKVRKIGCGARHSVVLDYEGNLFTFGDNSEGQTIGHNTNNLTPQMFINENKLKIYDFTSGYYHNFFVDENGDIYCWGNSNDLKFGENYSVPFSIPKHLLKLKGKNVNYISLGETISAISVSSKDNSIFIKMKIK